MPRARVQRFVADNVRRCYGAEIVQETLAAVGKLVTISKFEGVDYQSNIAFRLAKQVRQSPQTVAQNILNNAPDCSALANVSVSPQGFINMTLSDGYLREVVRGHALNETLQHGQDTTAKNVLIDFCSPNIGKQLHPGHMRSMFWGDTISNILEFCGHRVTRVSHVGDFGLPAAMLAQHCLENANRLEWVKHLVSGGEGACAVPSLGELGRLYVEAKQRMDRAGTDGFTSRVNHLLLHMQMSMCGESICGAYNNPFDSSMEWNSVQNVIAQVSRDSNHVLYEELGIEVHDRPESTYAPMLPGIVQELLRKGLAVESEGAIVTGMYSEVGAALDSPMLIRKSDGTFLYATVDIAAIKHRISQDMNDWLIYVTDSGQGLHFRQLFASATSAGWCKRPGSPVVALDHVGHGVIQGEDGKKLSSRRGDASLKDLLEEAIMRVENLLIDPASYIRTSKVIDNPEEMKAMSTTIGTNAVRYFDLKAGRRSYRLDYPTMLNFKGNTSVYLQYTYTRFRNICRSVETDPEKSAEIVAGDVAFGNSFERDLGLALARFHDVVGSSADELAPNLLCDHMFLICQSANTFYEHCRVFGSPEESSRLAICHAVVNVLNCGMGLVGIEALEKM